MISAIFAAAFAVFPESCVTPDSMAVDAKDRLVISAANFADTKQPGAIFRIDNPGEKPYKWFDVPVEPTTGRASPMGIDFGDDGALYVVDNQPWTGEALTKGKGRVLRIAIKDDKPAGCEVIAEGLEHPNGIRYRNGKVYVTQSMFSKLGTAPGNFVSGLYRFDAAQRNVKVANSRDDKELVLTEVTRNKFCPYGLDGIVFDKKGNLYLGDFGDGELICVKFAEDGSVSEREVFARSPFDIERDPAKPGFIEYATSCPMRTTDGMNFGPDGWLYVVDFSNNAVAKVSPDGKAVGFARRDPEGSYATGGLNQPGEAIFWRGRLIAANFDAVVGNPDKVNAAHETPATLTEIK